MNKRDEAPRCLLVVARAGQSDEVVSLSPLQDRAEACCSRTTPKALAAESLKQVYVSVPSKLPQPTQPTSFSDRKLQDR